MIVVMLFLLVGGICLTQVVSNPRQVTLRWLRLGGMIGISLLAVAAAITAGGGMPTDSPSTLWGDRVWAYLPGWPWSALLVAAVPVVTQLILCQLARRNAQRLAAAIGFLIIAAVASLITIRLAGFGDTVQSKRGVVLCGLGAFASVAASAGLVGGFVMTMLLGHAYLTAGNEMTQAPFRRLVLLLAGLLGTRLLLSAWIGLWPWWRAASSASQTGITPPGGDIWLVVMLTARYAVGLIVPAVFTGMIYDCVKRRSNQSATGILYVAGILVIVGEGIALGLLTSTGRFF